MTGTWDGASAPVDITATATTKNRERLYARSAQLSALLLLTYGGGMEHFSTMDEIRRDHVLWLAHDLAEEIRELVCEE